jgi:hypothetical protein
MANTDNDALRHYATGGLVDPDDWINTYPRSEELHGLLTQHLLDQVKHSAPRSIMVSTPNAPSNRLTRHLDLAMLDYNDAETRILANRRVAEFVWKDPIDDLRKKELRGELALVLARIRDQRQSEIETESERLLRLTAHLPDAWI